VEHLVAVLVLAAGAELGIVEARRNVARIPCQCGFFDPMPLQEAVELQRAPCQLQVQCVSVVEVFGVLPAAAG